MKTNLMDGDTKMDLLKQYLRQILDLGDTALSALAGVIYSRLDGLPTLTQNPNGSPVMRAIIRGVPYQFSRRAASIVVHDGDYGMIMGNVTEDVSLSYLRGIFEPPRIAS